MAINPLTGLEEEDDLQKVISQADTDRQKAVEENNSPDWGGALQAGLAGVGAAFQGRDSMAASNNILNQRREEKKDKLTALDKWKQSKVQDILAQRESKKYGRDEDLQKREMDSASAESKIAQEAAVKMGYKGDATKLTAQQFKEFSPAMEKIYQVEQAAQSRRDTLNAKREESAAKRNEGVTAGRKAVDADFAKDYNDWTSGGQASVDKNLDRLREAKAKLENHKNDLFGTSGRFTGNLPDSLRSEESKRIRQDVQAAAQGALKATLGAQFTEKEGERIMKAAYDETLSPEANIAKLDSAIKELETTKVNKNSKSAYFERNGSLTGMNPTSNIVRGPNPDQGKTVKMKDPKGNIRLIPENQVAAAKAAGGILVEDQVAGGNF